MLIELISLEDIHPKDKYTIMSGAGSYSTAKAEFDSMLGTVKPYGNGIFVKTDGFYNLTLYPISSSGGFPTFQLYPRMNGKSYDKVRYDRGF